MVKCVIPAGVFMDLDEEGRFYAYYLCVNVYKGVHAC